MNPAIFAFMERCAPYLVFWSMTFTAITTIRIGRRVRMGIDRVRDSATYTELAGLPLTLLQSVCFAYAVWLGDGWSMLLFLWWGPGFIAVASTIIVAKARRVSIDWYPWRYPISFLCKGYYLVYATAFLVMEAPTMLFAFSVWIINDQFGKAFMSSDADRLRRTFDDLWLFRVLYPAGLLAPYLLSGMPNRVLFAAYGTALLAAWICGALFFRRKGLLRTRPDDASLLRNMIYFRKLRQ
ncbi:MAG: hypothetical protein ACREUQ_11185 [Burkholderiales bacterium]